MKKNLKSWLALLLAVAMVITSGAFVNLTYLRATDSETPVETQEEVTEEAEVPVEEKKKIRSRRSLLRLSKTSLILRKRLRKKRSLRARQKKLRQTKQATQ